MNAVEIEEAISALAEQAFDPAEFPFVFLQAFGNKDTTIKRLTVTWHGYRVSAQTPAASKDTIAYQVTNSPQRNVTVLFDSAVQWVSPSGSAVIGAWFADPGSPIRGRAYFGVMSHGTFTPLRLPRQVFGQIIAW